MEKVNLEPIDDKIIIKPIDPETVSAGGVFLPEGSQPEATSGVVVAIGPGPRMMGKEERYPMECAVGDLVYYPKFGAHKLEHDGEEYVVIKEGDLFCREPKKDPEVSKEAIKEALADTKPISDFELEKTKKNTKEFLDESNEVLDKDE